MKLCKDCKWFAVGEECHHESAVIRDYVHGKDHYLQASINRVYGGKNDCTPDARFFEEKIFVDIAGIRT